MEGGRGGGGGGGRTPRGKKNRGSSRGRGQDSPSARSPATTVSSSPVKQSPSVSSSIASPSLSTTPARVGRDEEPKVTTPSTPSPAVTTEATVTETPTKTTPVVSLPTTTSSPILAVHTTDSRTTSLPPKVSETMEGAEVTKDNIDKEVVITPPSVEAEQVVSETGEKPSAAPTPAVPILKPPTVATTKEDLELPEPPTPAPSTPILKPPTVATTKEDPKLPEPPTVATTKEDVKLPEPPTPAPAIPILKPQTVATTKEDLELREPPTPPLHDNPDKGNFSTESKVEDALKSRSQQPKTAKTLVVEPSKELERTTDAPLSVEIDPACISPAGGSGASSSQPRQTQPRSGTMSPSGYAYALHGPVGKPGYIGGVGFSDEEVDSAGESGRPGMQRRESAITAMETAVKRFSKRQWILLLFFGLIDFFAAVTISLQAPFFPAEAEKKGATATEYGFVFGIFEFVVFLTSPLYGRYMNKLGPKTVFSVCALITSMSTICFGLLDRIDDHTWFITLCFVCRIFEALGCAGFFTATFVIIACEFPETVATTFASLETFFGLGLIVGPTVGGALFDVGGFPLPFFVVGSCIFVTGLISGLVMPKIDKATNEDGTEEQGYGVWTILKIPSVALAALSIASTSMSLGFVSATLEPHIRRFGLTPLQTGLVFVINGGVYALTAPLWGLVCDYIRRPVYVTILGNLLIFISILFIGPAAFMPFDTILWVTIVGLVLQGIGFGCCLVSGFIVGLKDSMKYGLPDNMATYGVASGLWTSMISLGAWVGPSAGGVLYDTVGFREGSYLILVTSFVAGITILLHTCATSSLRSDEESQPLLRPISPLLGGKKDLEASTEGTPTSYGSTSGGDGAV